MATVTISITNCNAGPATVAKHDSVCFKSADSNSYTVTDLQSILAGTPHCGVLVPVGPNGSSSSSYTVTGTKGDHSYTITGTGSNKCKSGLPATPPVIIIDD